MDDHEWEVSRLWDEIRQLRQTVVLLAKFVGSNGYTGDMLDPTRTQFDEKIMPGWEPHVECPECGKSFLRRGGITLHMRKVHRADAAAIDKALNAVLNAAIDKALN